MDEFRPSFRSSDRRLEIVSGRSISGNKVYMMNRHRSPDPPGMSRPSQSSSSPSKPWGFNDPEMKRRRRIAKYKVYTVEGRVKASLRNGFRWIKNKCSQIVHGF
ncbi:uncharacterized protein LOC132268791 [Cornus florida]|uniref:uncharacterized protein LOC132268791 n=1 Tax=Cornus florida TaxID=4283 RepID=UPI00289DECB3|nr:uncharacterized protein LOC132268791 [Cornus florida]